MTFQMRRLTVIDHGHVTSIAFYDVAAFTAHDEGRIASSIEEDDRLLTGCQGFIQQVLQRIGDDAVIAAGQFLPHIDDGDFGQGPMADAFFQFHQDIVALKGLVIIA